MEENTKAAPQSSPLPWKHDDGLISSSNGLELADMDAANAALIVRRVNQGPAFDAMFAVLPWLIARHPAPCGFTITTNSNDPYTCGEDGRLCPTCQKVEEARAALKLAQESGR